jgi:hypothetical protein
VTFPQLNRDVVNEELAAGDGQAISGIEIREVRELAGKSAALARIGEDLTVAIAFATLYERHNE